MGDKDFIEEIDSMISEYLPREGSDEETETEETDTEEEETDEGSEEGEAEQEEEKEEEESESESDEDEDTEDDEEQEEEEGEEEDGKTPDLTGVLNEMSSGQLTIDDEDIDTGEQQEEQQQAQQPPAASLENFNPMEGVDFDDVMSSPEKFGVFLKGFAEQVYNAALESSARSTLNIVGYQVNQQLALKELTTQFYEDNQDLSAVRPFVGKVAEIIQSKNPKMPVGDVLEKTAKVVRQKLGLKKPKGGDGSATENGPRKKRGQKPKIGKSKRSKTPNRTKAGGPEPSKLENEIDDLLKDF